MASGLGPILNLQGKVDASNALVIVVVAAGDVSAPCGPIGNLVGSVDASNALRVRVK